MSRLMTKAEAKQWIETRVHSLMATPKSKRAEVLASIEAEVEAYKLKLSKFAKECIAEAKASTV